MRNCQICDNESSHTVDANYEGTEFHLFECRYCGHRYLDSLNATQAWFDTFYLTEYTTDDFSYSGARLDSLANLIASHAPSSVLDIGGTDGELVKRLRELKIPAAAG